MSATIPMANSTTSALEVHLIVERGDEEPAAASRAADRTFIALPWRAAELGLDSNGNPRIVSADEEEVGSAIVALPVRNRAGHARLLVFHEGDCDVRVNGQKVPRMAVLKELDVLRWEPRFQLHMVLFGRPGHGPAPVRWIGRECPHCRIQIDETARCLVCAWCGTTMHDDPSENGLHCARERSVCPGCGRAVLFSAGYSCLPDMER